MFSTSLALAIHQPLRLDTNGYYASLGIDPRASRREIIEAYRILGGQDDAWLTFVLKQLLDEGVRRRYDSVPLGDIFADAYVDEWFKRLLPIEVGAEGPIDTLIEVLDSGISRLDNQEVFAYYISGTDLEDVPRLKNLRRALIAALGGEEAYRLAIGYHGDVEPVKIVKLDNHVAVLIADYVVDDGAAIHRAVSRLRRLQTIPVAF